MNKGAKGETIWRLNSCLMNKTEGEVPRHLRHCLETREFQPCSIVGGDLWGGSGDRCHREAPVGQEPPWATQFAILRRKMELFSMITADLQKPTAWTDKSSDHSLDYGSLILRQGGFFLIVQGAVCPFVNLICTASIVSNVSFSCELELLLQMKSAVMKVSHSFRIYFTRLKKATNDAALCLSACWIIWV